MSDKVYLLSIRILISLVFAALANSSVSAQTDVFTYQGSLTNGGAAANGLFDMQFKLFNTPNVGTGTQQGGVVIHPSVQVTNGAFSVQLEFSALVFNGSDLYLEIGVRSAGDSNPYTLLNPRQQITSAPYAIRSQTADVANKLSFSCLGCVADTQIENVSGNKVIGVIPIGALPGGSANYIQNRTLQQPGSSFNISGDGAAGGTLSGSVVNSATQYNINGSRVLTAGNLTANLIAGIGAGSSISSGTSNSFFGFNAGQSTTTGAGNSFFGFYAGANNTSAAGNAFFGSSAGRNNTTGIANAIFGDSAGVFNTTSCCNSFFGTNSGFQTTEGYNAFFGYSAGFANTTGGWNSFVGYLAGSSNTIANNNSFFGAFSGKSNTTGEGNSFFGEGSGTSNTTGYNNSFFGASAGFGNTVGQGNTFFGVATGQSNTTGINNTFVGSGAGITNTTGNSNIAIGALADVGAGNLTNATAIGTGVVVSTSNTMVLGTNTIAVQVPGTLKVSTLGSAGTTTLCRNASQLIATCSSSLRYKEQIKPFSAGLELINRLRPITFSWKESHDRDLGLGAEDVASIEPLLVTYNDKGEVEGVKYDRIAVVMVNAIKEQQTQLEQQQDKVKQQQDQIAQQQILIEGLKKLVCQDHPDAEVCK